mgnify:CR=1 FL=1
MKPKKEVVEMKDEGDFHVSVEQHFEALSLNDNQRSAAMDILADADALEDKNGDTYISVRAYTDYILPRLDQLASSAREFQSLDDLRNYEALTRGFLHEWAIIIGNSSHHIAKEHRFESIDETAKTLERLIGDMRNIFEHLTEADRLFIEFGRAPKDSPTDSNT